MSLGAHPLGGRASLFVTVAALAGAACASQGEEARLQKLMDPETCKECHAEHYREWSGSMHAYAAEDPVFLAMNARGQEETDGALGDFCIGCHAPLAVREGLTTDGLNLDSVPKSMQGVTCYFCHNAIGSDGHSNNPLTLARDRTMRGSITDPVRNSMHESTYSPLLDGRTAESADLCGPCHDIVTPSPPAPAEVRLERTFAEWRGSVFSDEFRPDVVVSCNACHMHLVERPAAEAKGVRVPLRTAHTHDFPAVDTALTPFPEMEAQRRAVDAFLDATLRADLCVQQLDGVFRVRVQLDNVGSGHHFPSGAAQDRRVWVELRAFRDGTEIYSSGVVGDHEPIATLDDPDLWLFRDQLFDADGREVHMFWQAASFQSDVVPGQVLDDPSGRGFTSPARRRIFPPEGSDVDAIPGTPDRVTLLVRVRGVGLDVLEELVESGHLDEAIHDAMPTFELIPDRHLGSEVTLDFNAESVKSTRFDRFELPSSTPGEASYRCIGFPTVE